MPKTKIRPGEVVKRRLLEQPGQSISQLYQAYKREVQEARDQAAEIGEFSQRIMASESFRKYIWFGRQLGLMEEVGRGEPVTTRTGQTLYMVPPGANEVSMVEISSPTLLALTAEGEAEVTAWENLSKAYKERAANG